MRLIDTHDPAAAPKKAHAPRTAVMFDMAHTVPWKMSFEYDAAIDRDDKKLASSSSGTALCARTLAYRANRKMSRIKTALERFEQSKGPTRWLAVAGSCLFGPGVGTSLVSVFHGHSPDPVSLGFIVAGFLSFSASVMYYLRTPNNK